IRCRTESVDAPRLGEGARLRRTRSSTAQGAQRSWSEGPVPGRVGSRGEADAPSDREGRPSTAQAYFRYAEPGAGSPTKGWRGVPSPQAPVARAAFSAATSDPRAASGVLVARLCGVLPVRLPARSCACPPEPKGLPCLAAKPL